MEVVEEAVNPHDEHALNQFLATMCKYNVIRNKLPKYAAGTGFAKTLQALVTLWTTATQTCTPGMTAAAQAVQYPAAPCTSGNTNGATTAACNTHIAGHNGEAGTETEAAGSTAPNSGKTPSATRADINADTAATVTVTANATNIPTTPANPIGLYLATAARAARPTVRPLTRLPPRGTMDASGNATRSGY